MAETVNAPAAQHIPAATAAATTVRRSILVPVPFVAVSTFNRCHRPADARS